MVKQQLKLLFLFVFLPMYCMAISDVKITAQIDEAIESLPIKGTITVTHPANEAVQKESFRYQKKPLETNLSKTVPISGMTPLKISIFSFQLPAEEKGLYVLSEISVNVGTERFVTIPSTFEVQSADKAKTGANGTKPTSPTSKAQLKLEALVDSPKPIYPGQPIVFTYRFLFDGDIELVEEQLPLLEAKGFKKIGDKVINSTFEKGWNVQQVSQKVKAIEPGHYNFPASVVEGYSYTTTGDQGKRNYIQPKIRAEALPITVVVESFPANAPPSFKGAVGEFTFQTSLLTPTNTYVDDKMQLALDFTSADAFLESVSLPPLNQPEFTTLFRLGDLPASGEVTGNTKRFVVDIYPLSTSAKAIPAIEFSSLDPITGLYDTIYSVPIRITVQPRENKSTETVIEKTVEEPSNTVSPILEPIKAPYQKPKTIESEEIKIEKPQPIEIIGNENLTEKDMHNTPFGSWWVLWIIPLGLLALAAQYFLREKKAKDALTIKHKNSAELWQEAMLSNVHDSDFFQTVQQAFLNRLYERGDITSPNISPDALPFEGNTGKVRLLLLRMEAFRFSKQPEEKLDDLIAEAKELFADLS